MHSFAPAWQFAKTVYDQLRDTPHEPAARAYLDATARLVLLSVAAQQRAQQQG